MDCVNLLVHDIPFAHINYPAQFLSILGDIELPHGSNDHQAQ